MSESTTKAPASPAPSSPTAWIGAAVRLGLFLINAIAAEMVRQSVRQAGRTRPAEPEPAPEPEPAGGLPGELVRNVLKAAVEHVGPNGGSKDTYFLLRDAVAVLQAVTQSPEPAT